MTSPGNDPATDVEQHCYRHPSEATGVRCTRCDRPICPRCMTTASVGFQCPECVREGNKSVRQARTIYGGRVHGGGRIGIVTETLIGINVVVFIATSIGGVSIASNGGTSNLFVHLALIPLVAHGQYYRLVTSMFLHFSVLHILFNMYALYLTGPTLEAALGRVRYVGLYFLAGIGGSILTLLTGPAFEFAAGASGAIFGLFGAFFLLARDRGWQTNGILLTIGLNLALSFSFSNEIDWRGHVGGLIVGLAVMGIFMMVPHGPNRARLQGLGVGAIALVLVALSFAGVHRMNSVCHHPTDPGTASFCAAYDPQ